MKLLVKIMLLVAIGFIILTDVVKGQVVDPVEVVETGYVSFSLGKSPVMPASKQELTLYGCNTRIKITTKDSVLYQTGDSI